MIRSSRNYFLISIFGLVFFLPGVISAQKNSPKVIANIIVVGNEKTQETIILRELTFKSGDSIHDIGKELERSKSNLINTLLFNYVEIRPLPIDSTFTDVLIQLKERWYLWPLPVFKLAETNFNTWWLTRDFRRTNYGLLLLKRNCRGLNEDLAFKAQFGYSKEFAFYYKMPYITRQQNIGASLYAGYKQQEEITVGTENNKRVFFRSGTGKTREEYSVKLSAFMRKKLYFTHTLELSYHNNLVVDSLTRFTNDYFFRNEPHTEYPGLFYSFRYDKRDNRGYPLLGNFLQLELHKFGTSFFNHKNLNVFYAIATIKKYFKFNDRFYAAGQLKGRYSATGNIPYYFQQALGYEHFVRGYEYYVIDGQHYGLFKTNLKYNLVRPHTYPVEFLKRTNFYLFHYSVFLNVFVDAGYVWDNRYFRQNPLANEQIFGTGLGLDIVTYYDKVVRFEYSLNKDFKHGFYIHFVQPI